MNIEELNSCFDAISPTKEQKDRIFAGIMNAKQQPVKVVRLYRYATAAAAVIVIGAFAAVYSNIQTNDVTNVGNKTIVAVENSIDNVENTTVTEEIIETENVEILPETNNVRAEEKGLADLIVEEYPQIVEEVPEDVKVAVEDEQFTVMNKGVDTDSLVPEVAMDTSEDEAVAPASAGGGGGGGASAYRIAEYEYVSLEQIMNDEVYGNLFPTIFVDGFQFVSATDDNVLKAVFNDSQGRYMSVSVTKDTFVEEIVEPEDIVNLKAEYVFLNFAVNCGEYYVVYNVESEDASQVYEMVKSSAYFKN